MGRQWEGMYSEGGSNQICLQLLSQVPASPPPNLSDQTRSSLGERLLFKSLLYLQPWARCLAHSKGL